MTYRPYPDADRARHQLDRHAPAATLSGLDALRDLMPTAEQAMANIAAALRVLPSADAYFAQAAQGAVELERYYASAQALGAGRARATAALREAQGPRADSSPNTADLDAAIQRLSSGA